MLPRPKARESDKDLLALQDEFFKRQKDNQFKGEINSLSTDVVRMQGGRDVVDLYESNQSDAVTTTSSHINHNHSLDATMVTCPVTECIRPGSINRITSSAGGFPSVVKERVYGSESTCPGSGKKLSLFARNFDKHSLSDFGLIKSSTELRADGVGGVYRDKVRLSYKSTELGDRTASGGASLMSGAGLELPKGSDISLELNKIHQENVELIEEMDPEEILEHQRMLKKRLDPKILEFIWRKGRIGMEQRTMGDTAPSDTQTAASEIQTAPSDTETAPSDTQSAPSDIQTAPSDTQTAPTAPSETETAGFSTNRSWLNMDVVESDKLEWMKPVAIPPGCVGRNKPRFDFQGLLCSIDTANNRSSHDNVANQGLCHHGDDPMLPGYTLDELVYLARSSIDNQRRFALSTMAQVVSHLHRSQFDSELSESLLQVFLHPEFIYLTRVSIDDKVPVVLNAAIALLRGLIYVEADEIFLEINYVNYLGHVTPSFVTSMNLQDDEDSRSPEMRTIDSDVVKGLLMTGILNRFRYLLEEYRLDTISVFNLLDILCVISRHGLESSVRVVESPRLLQTIYSNYLPSTWTPISTAIKDLQDPRGYPVARVIKLTATICSTSENLSRILVNKLGLESVISRIISVDPRNLNLNITDAISLRHEVIHLWSTLATYRVLDNLQEDLNPIICSNLQSCLRLDVSQQINPIDADFLSSLIKLIDLLTNSINTDSINHRHFSLSKSTFAIILALAKQLLSQCSEINYNYLTNRVLSSLFNYLSSYFVTFINVDATYLTSVIQDFSISILIPFSLSKYVASLFDNLQTVSYVGHSITSEFLSANSIMYLHCGTFQNALSPSGSVIPVLAALFRLINATLSKLPDLADKYSFLINNPCLTNYIASVSNNINVPLQSHFIVRNELHFIYWMSQFAIYTPLCGHDWKSLPWKLVFLLSAGQEWILHDIFSKCLFSPEFQPDSAATKLTENYRIISAENLRNIRNTYIACLPCTPKTMEVSRCYYSNHAPTSCRINNSGRLMPCDWLYLPVVRLYEGSCSNSAHIRSDSLSQEHLANIDDCLKMALYFHQTNKSAFDWLSPTVHFTRLLCVFLLADDTFLHPPIRESLKSLLWQLNPYWSLLELESAIPGLGSAFIDFYSNFVEQFKSVSYGDPTFCNFVLIPMRNRYSPRYRLLMWTDRELLRIMTSLPRQQLCFDVEELEEVVEPSRESDRKIVDRIIQLQQSALRNGYLTSTDSVPYLVAVANIQRQSK